MYKGITLNQFIGELQKLAVSHGNDEISSIGSSSGKIVGMSSPFCFNFKGHDATEFVPAYQHDVKPLAQSVSERVAKGELRHVWARVGMTLDITPEEEKAIFEGDYLAGKEVVKRVIMDGRASLDGETYVPEECIEDYDQEYGTNYRGGPEERAWSLDGDKVNAGETLGPCKLGDTVFALFFDEVSGKTFIDELTITEVSARRIWVAGDYDYTADDIGKAVFLSKAAAEAYLDSPEYLAARVNMVLHLNVPNEAKKELLVAGFHAGQEFFEKDTGKYIKLTHTNPDYIWNFDVFDANKELLYSTSAVSGRLALDILNGAVVPSAMVQEKSVGEMISEASDKSLETGKNASLQREVDFDK